MTQGSCHTHWLKSITSNIPTNEQLLAVAGISKGLCVKTNTKPFFSTFNTNISVYWHSLFIILDYLYVGHKLLFDVTGKKCFWSIINCLAKVHNVIIIQRWFFLASNSLCSYNIVKCETMLTFLNIYKRTVIWVTVIYQFLLLLVKLRKAFGLGILTLSIFE